MWLSPDLFLFLPTDCFEGTAAWLPFCVLEIGPCRICEADMAAALGMSAEQIRSGLFVVANGRRLRMHPAQGSHPQYCWNTLAFEFLRDNIWH